MKDLWTINVLSSILESFDRGKAKKRMGNMNDKRVGRMPYLVCLLVVLSLLIGFQHAWSGALRLNMSDGSFLEVPYYWEEAGEYKFEIAGGTVGVPKAQVNSVQEILAAREFDPQVLLEQPKEKSVLDQRKALEEIIAAKTPAGSPYRRLSPEESSRLLQLSSVRTREAGQADERVFASNYNVEGDFAELVKTDTNGVALLLRNVLSSRADLRNQGFVMTLYDGEGNALLRKPCEVRLLDVDQRTLRKMGIRGNLYSVMAAVMPDPGIKRYEITSAAR